MNKIVIAIDSFKGSLTSMEAGNAASRGARRVFGDAEIVVENVADGGEGTLASLVEAFGGQTLTAEVLDPLGRPIQARYGIAADVAVVEMAEASGLGLVEERLRDPMAANTRGFGQLIAEALRRGCRRLIVGIGGSATNDGGMGMLSALGFRFLDAEGHELEACGANLMKVAKINRSGALPRLKEARFTVACDVDNPFAGPRGAAMVFGPQKCHGSDCEAICRRLDEGMKAFAKVIEKSTGVAVADFPGAGAAGGVGGAMLAFLGAELKPGVDIVLDSQGFDEALVGADLVITGEGRLDRQTIMGKTASGILRRARKSGVPVLAVGGSVEDSGLLTEAGFMAALPIQSGPVDLRKAMDKATAEANIERTVEQALRIVERFTR